MVRANIGIAEFPHPPVSFNADCFLEGVPRKSWRTNASRKTDISKDRGRFPRARSMTSAARTKSEV
jgi:hypothetical protein